MMKIFTISGFGFLLCLVVECVFWDVLSCLMNSFGSPEGLLILLRKTWLEQLI